MWAEHCVSLPAIGRPVTMPFPPENRACWLYVDDCAEQLVRLALKDRLGYFVYNSGGHSATAGEFAAVVRSVLPEAQIEFSVGGPMTPLVHNLDGTRLRSEIEFEPRSLHAGVLAHINEARSQYGLPSVGGPRATTL
jgi:nucleoside-diphosphate-sugar epimerase